MLNVGMIELLLVLFFLLLGCIPLILAVMALIDLWKRDFSGRGQERVLLTLLIVFAPFIGSLVYFLVIKNNYPIRLQKHY